MTFVASLSNLYVLLSMVEKAPNCSFLVFLAWLLAQLVPAVL